MDQSQASEKGLRNSDKGGKLKHKKENPFLVTQTYISPEGLNPFQFGNILNSVEKDLDIPKGSSDSVDATRQVLSIQTYSSPEGDSPNQHGIITNTVVSELDHVGSHHERTNRKSKDKRSKSHKDKNGIHDGQESPVLAVQTVTSPDGQPPFFHGTITDAVTTELDTSEEHHKHNKKHFFNMNHTKSKDKKRQVLSIETYTSPEGDSPNQRGILTNTVVSELENVGSHHEKSNSKSKDKKKSVLSIQTYTSECKGPIQQGVITNTVFSDLDNDGTNSKSEDKHSKSHKDRNGVQAGQASPVLAVQTVTSPDGQPPFFHGTITDTIMTELNKPAVHHKKEASSPNVHNHNGTEVPETKVLY